MWYDFYPTRCVFSIPSPRLGDRKHTTRWMKIIPHHKPWEILYYTSCEIVALREFFVDRPESYDSFSAENCIFLAHEKTRKVWVIFIHFHTKPDSKQGIKKFLRHFPTTLVPSLTLQISYIVRSNLESPTLEFSLIICLIQDLDVWSRGKGKSSFVM
jgi:hypothetical protein